MKCVKESDVQRQLRQGRFLWNLRNRLECDQHVVRKSMHMVKRLAFFFSFDVRGKVYLRFCAQRRFTSSER